MNLKQLKQLIKKGESQVLEFKKSTTQLKPAFETICAFLNGEGGTLLFGVTDNGQILGQSVSDMTKQAIANEIHKLEPSVRLNVKYVQIENNKQVVIIHAEPGAHVPYVYDGRSFQRDQSVTKRMSQQNYDILVSQRNSMHFSWERMPAHKYTIKNLDHEQILNVVHSAIANGRMPAEASKENVHDILKHLQLLTENEHLSNAAVVLFGTSGISEYLQCQLKVARFKGVDRSEFMDNDLFRGNLFNLLSQGMMFIRRHIPVEAKIESGELQRIETPLIPFKAIREALINALCHRDYSSPSGSIGLAIYDDRMEIFNDARTLPGTTLKRIKQGYSNPPNPLIAEVCYRYGLIEKWGRGIPGIIASCKAANDSEPEFTIDKVEFRITFPFPASIKPPIVFTAENKFSELTTQQKEIVDVLHKFGPLSTKEIKNKLIDSPTERRLRDRLNHLLNLEVISVMGSTNNRKWFINKK